MSGVRAVKDNAAAGGIPPPAQAVGGVGERKRGRLGRAAALPGLILDGAGARPLVTLARNACGPEREAGSRDVVGVRRCFVNQVE